MLPAWMGLFHSWGPRSTVDPTLRSTRRAVHLGGTIEAGLHVAGLLVCTVLLQCWTLCRYVE